MTPTSCSLVLCLVLVSQSQEQQRDVGKALVEQPLLGALADSKPATAAPGKVAPGLVAWHPDFRSACAAARRSTKPVLLFQLLGRLDDELC